jgi:hypothetical protein
MAGSQKDASYYRTKAELCRRLAGQISEDDVRQALLELAREFDANAAELDAAPKQGCNGC